MRLRRARLAGSPPSGTASELTTPNDVTSGSAGTYWSRSSATSTTVCSTCSGTLPAGMPTRL